jgi:large subunit ribosomal protein L24
MKLRIQNGSTVEVIAGADKGKRGSVLKIDPIKMRIMVQGVGVKTHYSREDGLQKKEGFIHYSNVKLIERAKQAPAAKKTKKAKKAAK